MRLPVFTSLPGYRAGWLRGDAVAGLTVGRCWSRRRGGPGTGFRARKVAWPP